MSENCEDVATGWGEGMRSFLWAQDVNQAGLCQHSGSTVELGINV